MNPHTRRTPNAPHARDRCGRSRAMGTKGGNVLQMLDETWWLAYCCCTVSQRRLPCVSLALCRTRRRHTPCSRCSSPQTSCPLASQGVGCATCTKPHLCEGNQKLMCLKSNCSGDLVIARTPLLAARVLARRKCALSACRPLAGKLTYARCRLSLSRSSAAGRKDSSWARRRRAASTNPSSVPRTEGPASASAAE